MSRRLVLLAALSLAALPVFAASPIDQASVEKSFDAGIHPDELRDWMKLMAAEPNQVGGAHDKQNAEWILAQFKSWGWDAKIETFEVLYPTPISETLEITGAKPFKATLQEPAVPGDESSTHLQNALPAYVAYQGDGDVTGQLVYVNYGMPDDYKALERMGISVQGKIVITRYGQGWRGLKPKLAQEHGAIGCLIYSDPADDGYGADDVYPKGPARPPQGIQRGSVADMTTFPGDPLTPGIGATKDAKRLAIAEAPTILKIPVLPISYGDAQVFLSALGGPVAPANFRGQLPITYHVGPGEPNVHLMVKSDWSLKTIYDVIATMKGSTYPDQWVIRGNHHDGWVYGASDPLAGQVALLAEAKSIGMLAKSGWKPKRTIVYASWDAEEPMLVGSTEWLETHEAELQQKTVLYINSDVNERGFLSANGSHDFQHLINQVAASVIDPETNVTVSERWRAHARVEAASSGASARVIEEAKAAAQKDKDFPIGPLGSGSDYSSFLQHAGIPSVDVAFLHEGELGGVYHSAYDDFEHHSRFVDPGFVYDALLAKFAGRLVLRVADATLPLQRASDFASTVATYLGEVKRLADQKRDVADTQAGLLRDGAYKLAADPTKSSALPTPLDHVPHIEFAGLEDAVERLQHSAKTYDDVLSAKGASLSPDQIQHLQSLMLTVDETLTNDVGLPGRSWYKHLIYAPGRFTGYGAKTLPGVREAIEEQRWADADRYAKLTADALNAYSTRLDQAVSVLNPGG